MANERIDKKQEEQAFLLGFSNDITQARTKQGLQTANFTVPDKTLHTKLAMIRVIDDDGIHLSAYMFDRTLFEKAQVNFEKLMNDRITGSSRTSRTRRHQL